MTATRESWGGKNHQVKRTSYVYKIRNQKWNDGMDNGFIYTEMMGENNDNKNRAKHKREQSSQQIFVKVALNSIGAEKKTCNVRNKHFVKHQNYLAWSTERKEK
jgi:hypothetical protein